MTSRRHQTWVGVGFAAATLLILALIAAALVSTRERPFHYRIVFNNQNGLQRGGAVIFEGLEIGRVDSIEVDRANQSVIVGLRIEPDYRERIRLNSTGYIRDASLGGGTGRRVVEVVNAATPSMPMPPNSTVQGKESRLQIEAWRFRDRLEQWGGDIEGASKELSEGIQSFTEDLREFTQSEEYEELLHQLATLMDEFVKQGADGIMRLLENWETIDPQMAPMIEKLKEAGKSVAVEQFREFLKELEKEFQSAPAETESEAGASEPVASPVPATAPQATATEVSAEPRVEESEPAPAEPPGQPLTDPR